MIDAKTTTRINVQISEAELALDCLASGLASDAERQRSVDTIRLALKIFEHKILRIKELETQIESIRHLRTNRNLVGDVELIEEIAAQDRKILEYQNTIQLMHNKKTGT